MAMQPPQRWSAEVVRTGHGLEYAAHPRVGADMLEDGLAWGSREHLVDPTGRWTFDEAVAAAYGLAHRLIDLGVTPGDRVLLRGPASAAVVIGWWGILAAGAVAVPVNPRWGPAELDHAHALVEPTLVLSDGTDSAVDWATIGSTPGADPKVHVEASDPAAVIFTAGTTGFPKGATLSQGALVAGAQNLLAPRNMLPHQMVDRPGPVSLMTVPPFHIGGMTAVTANMVCGGTLVFVSPRFDAAETLDVIERERVSTWGAIPTMLSRVLDVAEREGRTVDSLRTITIGGSSIPAGLPERIAAVFPSAARGGGNTYGMTEAGGHIATAARRVAAEHPGSSGKPLPAVEVRIAPHPSAEPPAGEILVRSPSAMSGYWGLPDDPTRDADGWIHSGDLGRIDEAGMLYVTGRSKDVIIRGGENIAAAYVEAHLLGHPAVAEAVVVGLPHPDLGEEVGAVVRWSEDHRSTPEELRDHLRARLSHFQVPTRWWIRDDPMPTSDVGKVLKRTLVQTWPEDS